jgi:hypothetical protein
MNYDKLTEEEAIDILKQDFDPLEVETWLNRGEIISAPDVLYYADAYGDLEDAILLQSWDKTLPVRVHKGLLDSGLDIFEAVNNHDLEKERCPCCDSDMYRFEMPVGNYTNYEWVDEWGNVTDEWIEYVSDVDSHIWNANPEPDHAPILCPACSMDSHYDFPRTASSSGSVRIHYGETDEISGFSISGNLVRWDFEGYFGDGMTDLWGLPGGHEEGLAKALASGGDYSLSDWLDEHGWTEIAQATVKEAIPPGGRTYKAKKEYRRLAEEWAEGFETHPDLDFTYVIDFSTFGAPSFFVPAEHEDALLDEIVDLIRRRI